MGHVVYGLLLTIHILFALFMIVIILLQGGRGSLGETMGGAAAQSLFGGSANTVMTKTTAVVAGLFMVTCLSLARLSTVRGGSVIDQLPMSPEQLPLALPTQPAAPSSGPTTPSNPQGAGTSAQAPAQPVPPVPPPATSPASTETTP